MKAFAAIVLLAVVAAANAGAVLGGLGYAGVAPLAAVSPLGLGYGYGGLYGAGLGYGRLGLGYGGLGYGRVGLGYGGLGLGYGRVGLGYSGLYSGLGYAGAYGLGGKVLL